MEEFKPETIKTDFLKESIILGIDEAGRGPVLGPMVYACAYWDEKYNKQLKNYFQFDDSKKLTPEKREKIYEKINKYPDLIRYEKIVISPEELSYKMQLRNKISLNEISQDAACELIRKAKIRGANIKKIFVDTIGAPDKYRMLIEKSINDKKIKVTVESKADANYPCVSAASIVAKVTRDKNIEEWEYKEKGEYFGKDTGSGYTSDPYTVKWLKNNYDPIFGYPSFVRFSWKTIQKIFKDNGDICEWENFKEDDDKKKNWKKKDEPDKFQTKLHFGKEDVKEEMENDDYSKDSVLYKNFYDINQLSFNVDI